MIKGWWLVYRNKEPFGLITAESKDDAEASVRQSLLGEKGDHAVHAEKAMQAPIEDFERMAGIAIIQTLAQLVGMVAARQTGRGGLHIPGGN